SKLGRPTTATSETKTLPQTLARRQTPVVARSRRPPRPSPAATTHHSWPRDGSPAQSQAASVPQSLPPFLRFSTHSLAPHQSRSRGQRWRPWATTCGWTSTSSPSSASRPPTRPATS
uniref:Mediator complex subunit 17 n=1 Tax=Aegilops tauschii subsp. strangulata TaxID=200361 RepID=A0A453SWD2_AEGTS